MSVVIYFDFTCRFANRVHLWLRDADDIAVDWRPFSLLEAKRDDGGSPVWERDEYADDISLLMLAGHELVRDAGGDIGRYRARVFAAWHGSDERLDAGSVLRSMAAPAWTPIGPRWPSVVVCSATATTTRSHAGCSCRRRSCSRPAAAASCGFVPCRAAPTRRRCSTRCVRLPMTRRNWPTSSRCAADRTANADQRAAATAVASHTAAAVAPRPESSIYRADMTDHDTRAPSGRRPVHSDAGSSHARTGGGRVMWAVGAACLVVAWRRSWRRRGRGPAR